LKSFEEDIYIYIRRIELGWKNKVNVGRFSIWKKAKDLIKDYYGFDRFSYDAKNCFVICWMLK
jgi:hypothetical protein